MSASTNAGLPPQDAGRGEDGRFSFVPRVTRTYAVLVVSADCYAEVRRRLELAGAEYVQRYVQTCATHGEVIVLGEVALARA